MSFKRLHRVSQEFVGYTSKKIIIVECDHTI